MNAKSHNAAVLLNDLLVRLCWHGWHASATDNAALIVLQYKSEKYGCWRAVDCDALKLARFLKHHHTRHEVADICDKKPVHKGAAAQQELDFSGQSALVRDALNPNKQ